MGANFKKKRERFYKKQFTLPVMFSIPTAITEEICLSSRPLPRSAAEKPSADVCVVSLLPWKPCHTRMVTSQGDGEGGGERGLKGGVRNGYQKGGKQP